MKRWNTGFTLAELLILVAIIAVLVGISIPIFSVQLEKSREAVDLANVRSAYAMVVVAVSSEDTSSPLYKSDGYYLSEVPLKQTSEGWTTKMDNTAIGGIPYVDNTHWLHAPAPGGTCKVYYEHGAVFIDWGNEAKKPIKPVKQDHINVISASEFLTKEILSTILPANYPYAVINSNEPESQEGGTKLFMDYARDHGFDLKDDYGATTWQIYAKESNTGSILLNPAIYWSTISLDAQMADKDCFVPVMGYRDGKYDVYMAKVVRYNGGKPNEYISFHNGFASVTDGEDGYGGNATFQFETYGEALEKYNAALSLYQKNGTLSYADMKALGLTG